MAAHPGTGTPIARAARRRGRWWLPLAGLCAALAAYVGWAAWLWQRSATVTFDPVERLRQMTPVGAEGERAWPLYRDALGWHRQMRRAAREASTESEFTDTLHAAPGTPAWEGAVALVSEHAKEIELLRRAAAMPVLGFVPGHPMAPEDEAYVGANDASFPVSWAEEFPALAISLPFYEEIGGAAALLRIEALHAAEQGQGARAVGAIEAMVRVAEHSDQVPVLVGSLGKCSVLVKAAETAVSALALKPTAFKPADLERLDSVLAAAARANARINIEGERLMMQDVLQRMYTDDGEGNGSLLLPTAVRVDALAQPLSPGTGHERVPMPRALWFLAGPYMSVVAADRARVHSLWDGALREAEEQYGRPVWQQEYPQEAALMPIYGAQGAERMAYLPVAVLTPAMSNVGQVVGRARVYAAAARAQCAIERYRRDHGAWPDTLATLVPKYLPAVPMDEFVNAPLVYRIENGAPRIVSVGAGNGDEIIISR